MEKRRMTSYNILEEVFDKGESLKESFSNHVSDCSKSDAAFIKELTYGTTRMKLLLDYYFSKSVNKEMTNVSKKTKHLIRMALYEILFMNHKDYAVISSAVDIAKSRLKNADKFVNWSLREFLRNYKNVKEPETNSKQSLSYRYSFPQHLVEYLVSEVGTERAVQLMKFYNQKPVHYALNTDTGEYREFDNESRLTPKEYILDPLYLNIFRFLQLEKVSDVLDCCAAPGGKSFLLKTFVKSAKITALDSNEQRVEIMRENIKRLKIDGIKAENQDLLKSDLNKVFDLVILDVPCTATGTIRKNPDVKYNYKKKLDSITELQYKMLKKADDYVKEDGFLLYMTCSILNAENHAIISRFVSKNCEYKVYSQFFSFGDPFNGGYGVLLRKSGGVNV